MCPGFPSPPSTEHYPLDCHCAVAIVSYRIGCTHMLTGTGTATVVAGSYPYSVELGQKQLRSTQSPSSNRKPLPLSKVLYVEIFCKSIIARMENIDSTSTSYSTVYVHSRTVQYVLLVEIRRFTSFLFDMCLKVSCRSYNIVPWNSPQLC